MAFCEPRCLVSSNPKKLAEYARYGLCLALTAGDDLPEVDGTPDEVALYKALAAGPGAVVEDTILIIEGVPQVDIKWTLDAVREKPATAEWMVTLAHHAGDEVRLYRGVCRGRLEPGPPPPEGFFGFDPWFVPEGHTETVHRLTQAGRKHEVSPRRLAAEALKAEHAVRTVSVDKIPPWQGRWQTPGA